MVGTCQHITEKVALSTETSAFQKLQIGAHLGICQACWLYFAQLKILRKSYRRLVAQRLAALSGEHVSQQTSLLIERFTKK